MAQCFNCPGKSFQVRDLEPDLLLGTYSMKRVLVRCRKEETGFKVVPDGP